MAPSWVSSATSRATEVARSALQTAGHLSGLSLRWLAVGGTGTGRFGPQTFSGSTVGRQANDPHLGSQFQAYNSFNRFQVRASCRASMMKPPLRGSPSLRSSAFRPIVPTGHPRSSRSCHGYSHHLRRATGAARMGPAALPAATAAPVVPAKRWSPSPIRLSVSGCPLEMRAPISWTTSGDSANFP